MAGAIQFELPAIRTDQEVDGVLEHLTAAVGRAFELVAVKEFLRAQAREAADLGRDLTRITDRAIGPPGAMPTAAASVLLPTDDADDGGTRTEDRGLTPRQRETLGLVARGLTNAEIAERLVISEGTVKSHVGAILRAAGAVNRNEAVQRLGASTRTWASEHGSPLVRFPTAAAEGMTF